MKYVIFDVETTGNGTKDEVIQFAAIITDQKLAVQRMINVFCNTTQPIHPEAYRVHGITKEVVIEKSNQKFFEDLVRTEPILSTDPNVTFISYGIGFDTRLCNQTLLNNGHAAIEFGDRVSVLRSRTKGGRYNFDMLRTCSILYNNGYNISQEASFDKVLRAEGLTKEQIINAFNHTVERFKPEHGPLRVGAHDALYDSFILFVLLSKLKGMIFSG